MPDFGRSTRNQNYDRQHEELYKDLVLMTARKNPRWSVHVVRTMLDIPSNNFALFTAPATINH